MCKTHRGVLASLAANDQQRLLPGAMAEDPNSRTSFCRNASPRARDAELRTANSPVGSGPWRATMNQPVEMRRSPPRPTAGRDIARPRPTATTRACRAASGSGGRFALQLVHGYALAFASSRHARSTSATGAWTSGAQARAAWLHEIFDHTMLVAEDDPERLGSSPRTRGPRRSAHPAVGRMRGDGPLRLRLRRSQYVDAQTGGRVRLETVEVKETGGNSALYERA